MENTWEKTRPILRRPAGRRSITGGFVGCDTGFRRGLGFVTRRDRCASASAGALRGDLVGCSVLVAVEGESVDHEGVAEEIEVLAGMAEAVGASEPEGVDEVSVDRFGVVAAWVETREVGVGGGDGPDVLGPVETPGPVRVGAVQAHGHGLAAEGVDGPVATRACACPMLPLAPVRGLFVSGTRNLTSSDSGVTDRHMGSDLESRPHFLTSRDAGESAPWFWHPLAVTPVPRGPATILDQHKAYDPAAAASGKGLA